MEEGLQHLAQEAANKGAKPMRRYDPAAFAEELRRFNEERKLCLGGQPISTERRIPGPDGLVRYTKLGGDIEPPEWAK